VRVDIVASLVVEGKGKGIKFTPEQATKALRGVEVQIYSFFNLGARWGECSTARPGRFTPRERSPAPIV